VFPCFRVFRASVFPLSRTPVNVYVRDREAPRGPHCSYNVSVCMYSRESSAMCSNYIRYMSYIAASTLRELARSAVRASQSGRVYVDEVNNGSYSLDPPLRNLHVKEPGPPAAPPGAKK
jgi:hypothetical protein